MWLNRAIVGVCATFSLVSWGVEYHGYMRSGIGLGHKGADQPCFKTPGSELGKARLGNECDTYIEAAFSQKMTPAASEGLIFKGHLRLALMSSAHRDFEPSTPFYTDQKTPPGLGQAFTTALREAFAEASGSELGGMTFWAGKRFYRRVDIHMYDFYLVDNSGPGVGVENIAMGGLNLHVAVTRNIPDHNTFDGPVQTNWDLRLDGLEIMGKLSLMVILGNTSAVGHSTGNETWEAMSGWQTGIFHRSKLGAYASNFAAIQYGTGVFGANSSWNASTLNHMGAWGATLIKKDDSDEKKQREDSSTLRIADQVVVNGSKSFSGEFVAIYQSVDFGGAKYSTAALPNQEGGTTASELKDVPNKTDLTLGLRPIYHVSKTTGLALEYSTTSVKKAGMGGEFKNSEGQKLTLAALLAPDSGYWVRPQLRLFATHASWNDVAKDAGAGDGIYSGDSGWSAGAQFEAWW